MKQAILITSPRPFGILISSILRHYFPFWFARYSDVEYSFFPCCFLVVILLLNLLLQNLF